MERIDLQTPAWELFHGQFFFTRERLAPGQDWHVLEFGGWFLYVHRALPVCRISDGTGSAIGVLLGYGIDLQGVVRDHDLRLAADASDDKAVERWLYTLGGRWACLLWTRHMKRFYLDPFGSLAAVY
ncbi:MAG: hypothetical protein R3330_06470, partial [Saprospiraceae bacterium]|nr:hypothetical protein [Saprospiraceae bacterium]